MRIDELVAKLEDVARLLDKNNGAKNELRCLIRRLATEGVDK